MAKNEVRIIGGKWKGRKLRFADRPALRPSLGRARETLFNWLAPDIVGAHCADLFAGSGSLGLEAASRGAASVTLIDNDPQTAASLRQLVKDLEAPCEVLKIDARRYLTARSAPFDVVFIDPPFDRKALAHATLDIIAQRHLLAPGGLVYWERPKRQAAPDTIAGFRWVKTATAGDTAFGLLAASS